MFKRLFRVRLLGSIDSMLGCAENATDLRGAFDFLIKELKNSRLQISSVLQINS